MVKNDPFGIEESDAPPSKQQEPQPSARTQEPPRRRDEGREPPAEFGGRSNGKPPSDPEKFEADTPPNNLEAEKGVLGSIILSVEMLPVAAQILEPEDFYHACHQVMWRAILALDAKGTPPDAINLSDQLKADGTLKELGGSESEAVDYLIHVMGSVPHSAHTEYYANIVRRESVRRRLLAEAFSLIRAAKAPDIDPADALDACRKELDAIQFRTADETSTLAYPLLQDVLIQATDRRAKGEEPGAHTGFADFDVIVGGVVPGMVIIIAARPSMGKTALAMQLAEGLSRCNQKTSMAFSLEQPKDEIGLRMLAMSSGVDSRKIKRGRFNDDELDLMANAAETYRDVKFVLDDKPERTVAQIMAKIRLEQRKGPVAGVFVDYMQLVKPAGKRQSREQDIAQIMRDFKLGARQLNVPFFLLSQLNRDLESRPDKRPRLSDLRESGSIEQDADVVMFLNRPEVYEPGNRVGEADLIIAKNRNGPVRDAVLRWIPELTKFECRATDAQEQAFGAFESDFEQQAQNDAERYGFFNLNDFQGP